MSTFFYSSYDSESSSDEDNLYYSDDERYLKQKEQLNKSSLLAVADSDESGDETMSESEEEEAEEEAEVNKKSAFLKSGDGDNESEVNEESDWSENDYSDSESDDDIAAKGRSYFLKSDFLKGGVSASDSEDEDEKKVVRSAKDKYLDELSVLSDKIENLSMVEEWVSLATEFDKLYRLAYKHNQYHISIPRTFIKAISVLEDAINNESSSKAENGKKLSASESKSLNILKQKVKREVKIYKDQVELYKEDPEAYEAAKDESNLIDEEYDSENKQMVVSVANLFSIVKSIIETRGKKGVDLNEHLKTLNELLNISESTYEKIVVLNLIISLRYELYSKEQYMPADEWNFALEDISKLLDILDSDKSYIVTEVAPPNDDLTTPPPANEDGKHLIVGSIASFVERLADELSSHLLYIDTNSTEYIALLKDDSKLYSIIVRAQTYLSQIIPSNKLGEIDGDQLCRIIIKRLESIYYKPVKLVILSELNAWSSLAIEENNVSKIVSSEASELSNVKQTNTLMDSLCSHLYNFSTGIQSSVYRKRAALMQAYYYSISSQFFRARDILHLTHVQTTIHTSEPGVQVLFNRAIVQLGLAAFRAGLVEESQTILNEVVTSQHTRDLLGQGRIYYSSNSSETGAAEKNKFVPFHMHINIELVDAVYYISSLLVEVPLMALQSYQGSTPGAINYANSEAQSQAQNIKKNVSRSFKRILDYTERQYFQGPAEETRDSVFEAYNELVRFNWKSASKILSELRVWGMMPGISVINADGKNGDELLTEMLVKSCKIQSLKTWIYVNSGLIKNYSVRKLASRFEINEEMVTSTIGGLIYREEIRAHLKFNENGSKTIIFETKEDGMGNIIRDLTERVNSILERNEKLSLGGYQIMMKKK
jgi:translation initiation factor 3 subunit C